MSEETKLEIGKVSHYYSKAGVAVVELSGELNAGDDILIEGKDINIRQKVTSMQIEHKDVHKAAAGQSIGMKVDGRVIDGCKVYKII